MPYLAMPLMGILGWVIVSSFVDTRRGIKFKRPQDWCELQYSRAKTARDTLYVDGMLASANPSRSGAAYAARCVTTRLEQLKREQSRKGAKGSYR